MRIPGENIMDDIGHNSAPQCLVQEEFAFDNSGVAEFVQDSQAAEAMVGAAVNAVSENRKLSKEHLSEIVDWLEVPDNFAMLHGSRPRLAVGEKHPS